MASITKCRSCGSRKLTEIANFGKQYLSEFRDDDTKPYQGPLDLLLCNNCTLVQLKESTDPSLLYNDNYGYYSGINNTIRENLKHIVEKARERVSLDEGDIVVDIGSNDGTLLKFYHDPINKIGFDPVSKFKKYYDEKGMIFINNYFNIKDYLAITRYKAKIITAISCFYDLETPNEFVEEMRKILHPNGIIVIQQNYLVTMMQNLAYDNIVHEHIEYYSLKSLEHLLKRHYLVIDTVELNTVNGGSICTYIRHMTTAERIREVEEQMRLRNKWTYLAFGMQVKHNAKQIHDFVEKEVKKGKVFYAYGASTRGNSLLQVCNLDNRHIKYAVERNPIKFGKKIAGLGIPIISEEQARKEKPDYFFVLPYFFKEEFIKREQEYLKSGGALLFPLPQFEVVRYEHKRNNTKHTK